VRRARHDVRSESCGPPALFAQRTWRLVFACVLTTANLLGAQIPRERPYIDLTTPPSRLQQGLGVPGSTGGGVGRTSLAPPKYHLPLQVQIARTSGRADGDFTVEVQFKNVGDIPFDFPIFRNISQVEQPGNKSRVVFFINIHPSLVKDPESLPIGSAATAGSTSVADSLMRLESGESVMVALRVDGRRARRAARSGEKQVDIRVVCQEWTLEDGRFFLRAESKDTVSSNSAAVILQE
jgi:hypothetical protein